MSGGSEPIAGNSNPDPKDWAEVSLMEFINGCLPDEYRLSEERSQPITEVITSKEKKLTWKEAKDNDNQNMIRLNQILKFDLPIVLL